MENQDKIWRKKIYALARISRLLTQALSFEKAMYHIFTLVNANKSSRKNEN